MSGHDERLNGSAADAAWQVWRQDDAGNRSLVRAGLSEVSARTLAAELEARGHKQMYWVECNGPR